MNLDALDFFAGCLGGCAGIIVGHPFDTLKVRLQMNPNYSGMWNCFKTSVKQESFRGLYKGMSSPIAGISFVNAVVFGVQGGVARRLRDPESLRSQTIAGATAGFCQAFINSPVELIKIRAQLQTGVVASAEVATSSTLSQTYETPLNLIRNIIATEGMNGLFRGQLITIIREVPAFAIYFYSYEYLERLWSRDGKEASTAAVLVAGGIAGINSWIFTYPIDVVKTRLQGDGINGITRYRGIWHCTRSCIAAEGWAVMSRGLLSTVIRAFPVNAATFATVSWTKRIILGNEENL